MVEGLDKFREYFAEFVDNYVVIGGTACDIVLAGSFMRPRATTDIDMIVVVENISREFGERFWQFISDGGYSPSKRTNDGETKYTMYRFVDSKPGYPIKIELLSRHSELLGPPRGIHIEPLPIDDDLSSLSVIVMDDDFYDLTVKSSINSNGIRIASPVALMALKSRAYLNLIAERAAGRKINTKDIKKHRSDVLKLAATTDIESPTIVHPGIYSTIKEFADRIHGELPSKSLEDALGSSTDDILTYLDALKSAFTLEEL